MHHLFSGRTANQKKRYYQYIYFLHSKKCGDIFFRDGAVCPTVNF
ncbi:hypothetical protein BN938_1891 [Mucinivorans hirudinis]|uniref:Uncharacterized protein n=1 Tax=Mucinivorans hirudinis TaxID=1433126 RepID=A0A060R8T5_9BACT|nr:hypothetical protein BN938_1891 [Mucinivorans hirudinis]